MGNVRSLSFLCRWILKEFRRTHAGYDSTSGAAALNIKRDGSPSLYIAGKADSKREEAAVWLWKRKREEIILIW